MRSRIIFYGCIMKISGFVYVYLSVQFFRHREIPPKLYIMREIYKFP